MGDLNAYEAGKGGKKTREAYRLPSLLYSEGAGPFGVAFDGANIGLTNSSSNTVSKIPAF
jgi:hypothetical protein